MIKGEKYYNISEEPKCGGKLEFIGWQLGIPGSVTKLGELSN